MNAERSLKRSRYGLRVGAAGGAILGLLCGAGVAAAEPTVRLVPGPNPGELLLDGRLPASTDFVVEWPNPGKNRVKAQIQVWPRDYPVDVIECPASPPQAERQSFQFAMSASGSDGERVFRARIPALEVGQVFCFSIKGTAELTDAQFRDLVTKATVALRNHLVAKCKFDAMAPDDLRLAMLAAIQAALPYIGVKSPRPEIAQAAAQAAEVAFTRLSGYDRCTKSKAAWQAQEGAQRSLQNAQDRLKATIREFDGFKGQIPSSPGGPLVLVNKAPMTALALARDAGLAQALPDAITQIEKQSELSSAEDQPRFKRWIDQLRELEKTSVAARAAQDAADKAPDDEKKRNAAVAAAAKLADLRAKLVKRPPPPAGSFALFDQANNRWIGLDEFLTRPEVVQPGDALDQLEKTYGAPTAAEQPVDKLRAQIRKLAGARTDERERLEAVSLAVSKSVEAQKSLEEVGVAALGSEEVRGKLESDLGFFTAQGGAGHGATPDKMNFASVDAGVMVSAPFLGADGDVWLVPYLGLNIYFRPVDRTLDFDQLVGSPFWQRFSVTAGITLSEPSIEGRTLSPILLGRFPVAAVGYRTSNYTRLTVGAVFYTIKDASPASRDVTLSIAPSVGYSLDLDLIHMLTSNMSK